MITYLTFTTEYPAYAALPYDQTIVEMRLKEISLLFPQIDSCLPEDTRLLATFYAYRVLDLEEDCDMEIGLVSVTSVNDKYVFKQGKTPFALNTTVWGNRLARLYRIHGCHINAAPSKSRGCGDC
jgi:hypothetical protein